LFSAFVSIAFFGGGLLLDRRGRERRNGSEGGGGTDSLYLLTYIYSWRKERWMDIEYL